MAEHHSTIKGGVLVQHPELHRVIISLSDHETQIGREYPRLKRPYAGGAELRSGGQNIDHEVHLGNLMGKSQNDLRHPVAWRQADVRAVNQWSGSPRDIDRIRRRPMTISKEKLAGLSDRFERRTGEMREVGSDGTADDRKGRLGWLARVRAWRVGFDAEAECG